MTAPFASLRHGFQRLRLHCRMWRLARCLNGPGREAAGGSLRGRVTVFAGIGLGLVLLGQMNAPAYLRQHTPMPCEAAGLAACVVMGPRQVKREDGKGGFTLIEMSIVLVIAGLIVGGVLMGLDLIAAATMQKQISQFDKWNAAMNAFQSKYNCLPGDCANATQFGLGANGDGNGAIGNGYFPGESQLAFVHLSAANLIEGNYSMSSTLPGIGYPASIINSASGFTVFSAIHSGQYNINGLYSYVDGGGIWFRAGLSNPTNPGYGFGWGGSLTPFQLQSLDTKIDDGLPFSGKVRLMGQDGGGFPLDIMCNNTAGAYGDMCVYNNWVTCANITVGSNKYLTTNSKAGCPYAVRAQ